RNACLNNIRQLGLAAQNYLSTHRVFPSGWIENSEFPDFAVSVNPFAEPFVLPASAGVSSTGTTGSSAGGPAMTYISDWVFGGEWSWHALMLPQMEQSTIAIRFDRSKQHHSEAAAATSAADSNWEYINIPIPSYVCPSATLPN